MEQLQQAARAMVRARLSHALRHLSRAMWKNVRCLCGSPANGRPARPDVEAARPIVMFTASKPQIARSLMRRIVTLTHSLRPSVCATLLCAVWTHGSGRPRASANAARPAAVVCKPEPCCVSTQTDPNGTPANVSPKPAGQVHNHPPRQLATHMRVTCVPAALVAIMEPAALNLTRLFVSAKMASKVRSVRLPTRAMGMSTHRTSAVPVS
mmetsp:Transcript_85484/g.207189  ORF Transcript_85484/g.207189 Transcript_85484/m.207189 type:complete len:210 (+) Transcript_85484:2810-3439(+)